MIDSAGSETPLLDTHLQAVEILRDPSHIRNYSVQEWLALFREAGFTATSAGSGRRAGILRLDGAAADAAGTCRGNPGVMERGTGRGAHIL